MAPPARLGRAARLAQRVTEDLRAEQRQAGPDTRDMRASPTTIVRAIPRTTVLPVGADPDAPDVTGVTGVSGVSGVSGVTDRTDRTDRTGVTSGSIVSSVSSHSADLALLTRLADPRALGPDRAELMTWIATASEAALLQLLAHPVFSLHRYLEQRQSGVPLYAGASRTATGTPLAGFLRRALHDAEAEGIVWSPLLDAIAQRGFWTRLTDVASPVSVSSFPTLTRQLDPLERWLAGDANVVPNAQGAIDGTATTRSWHYDLADVCELLAFQTPELLELVARWGQHWDTTLVVDLLTENPKERSTRMLARAAALRDTHRVHGAMGVTDVSDVSGASDGSGVSDGSCVKGVVAQGTPTTPFGEGVSSTADLQTRQAETSTSDGRGSRDPKRGRQAAHASTRTAPVAIVWFDDKGAPLLPVKIVLALLENPHLPPAGRSLVVDWLAQYYTIAAHNLPGSTFTHDVPAECYKRVEHALHEHASTAGLPPVTRAWLFTMARMSKTPPHARVLLDHVYLDERAEVPFERSTDGDDRTARRVARRLLSWDAGLSADDVTALATVFNRDPLDLFKNGRPTVLRDKRLMLREVATFLNRPDVPESARFDVLHGACARHHLRPSAFAEAILTNKLIEPSGASPALLRFLVRAVGHSDRVLSLITTHARGLCMRLSLQRVDPGVTVDPTPTLHPADASARGDWELPPEARALFLEIAQAKGIGENTRASLAHYPPAFKLPEVYAAVARGQKLGKSVTHALLTSATSDADWIRTWRQIARQEPDRAAMYLLARTDPLTTLTRRDLERLMTHCSTSWRASVLTAMSRFIDERGRMIRCGPSPVPAPSPRSP